MGRWAQQHRRGGSPVTASLPRMIGALDEGSGLLSLTFDRPVTFNASALPSIGSIEIDGALGDVTDGGQISANVVEIQQGVDPAAGTVISLPGQPDWLTTAIQTNTAVLIS
jgi:hypothetical protein